MIFNLVLLDLFVLLSVNNLFSEASVALRKFGNGNRRFTNNAYNILTNTSGGESLIFSPLSAQLVLSLTSEGARNRTATQLISALHLPKRCVNHAAIRQLNFNISTDILTLESANKLYIAENYALLQSFINVSIDVYKSESQNIDFSQNQQAADTINEWVEERTNNKIQNLISPNALSGDTRLVLVNTLYLNGKWETPFPTFLTQNGTFHLANGSTTEVRLMHSDTTKSSIYKCENFTSLGASFLELDIRDSNLSMVFLLPLQPNGLKTIENNLEQYLKPRNITSQRVAVTLPSFEVNSGSIDLKGILQELGVIDLFSQAAADLTGISAEKPLYVDSVVQKAFINVTETGVEAAAATAVGVSTTSVQLPPVLTFTADRQFLYYIVDKKSGIIYFVGRFTGA